MKRLVRITVIAATALIASVAPASAADGDVHGSAFHATADGFESGFIPGPNPGRCPAGTEWILQTNGTGEAAGYGTFTFTTEHCSRVATPTPTGAIGKLAAGELELTFDDTGDVLIIAYRGTWKFDGDLMTGDGIAEIHQSYEVLDGTGMFTGASGHGSMQGVDDFHRILMHMNGGLRLAE